MARGLLAAVVGAGLLCSLAGCSRDPNVRKQKYFESATRYFEKEQYHEAAIQYLNAIQIDGRFVEAHYQLAQCNLRTRVWQGAYVELLRTVEIQPEHLKAQLDLGNLLLAGREFAQAQERADLILKKEPNHVEAHILRANAQAGLENLQESFKEMKTAIQLAPDRPVSYLNLAILQASARQMAEAEASFNRAVQLDPRSVPAHLALGNFYMQQSRWADAEREFQRLVELQPDKALPRAALARLYLIQKQRDKAIQILAKTKAELRGDTEAYRLLGEFYFALGEVDNSLAEFESLYKEHPNDLRVKKNYIQLLILRNRLDEATRLNDEVLKANSRDADALIHRGQVLNRNGKPNDAIHVLEGALKSEPDNAVAHYHLGVGLSSIGNLARAESEWREAVRLRPNMTAAQQALALVAIRKNDVDLLLKSSEQLIAAEPFSPGGYVLRASALGARGNVAGVEADLKRAMDVAPQNPVGYSKTAGWRLNQKRYAEAEKLYEQALERDPNYLEALQGLVLVYNAQKQPARAVARVLAQIVKEPENSALPFLLAQVYLQQNDLEKCEAALQKSVALNKNNADAYLILGQVQSARGSADQAIASYRKTIQENPSDVRAYIMLGALHDSRGEWQKAQDLYERALQVQPDHPLASNNLAYLMIERGGNIDVALSHAQVARRGLPDLPNVADTLAWAYYQKGAFSLAVDLLEEALKKMPDNPTYHFHLGLAYQKTNNRAKAKAHLERALAIKPDSPQADQIRKALAQLSGA